jgi:DNA invertase Pin-like site-specific DNA recombinase
MLMERVCIYLRKSRADLEAEARGEGETLAKHKKTLFKTAKQLNLKIIKIREEIASGESLIHRPQMLELLQEVENCAYDAVIVMDMDRLGRGNMQEQGLILETFRKSDTKIITPRKTYDLKDEFDEEYSEFEAFMARKELKIITRRLQGGRIRAVEDGNYLGTRPPYGYKIKKLASGRTLEPDPEQAPVVKLIFQWYTHREPMQRIGAGKIANMLNSMGCKSYSGIDWQASAVLAILKNAVYAGRIQWKKKEEKKSTVPGKKEIIRTRPKDEWIDVLGKHEALITMETYTKAQNILQTKYHAPYQLEKGLTNPLAGLLKCEKCGASMIYRPFAHQKHPHLLCYNKSCNNKSSRFEYIEEKILKGLNNWLAQYKASWIKWNRPEKKHNLIEIMQVSVKNLERESAELEKQKNKLHDLLERGIYNEQTYLERTRILAKRLDEIRILLANVEKELLLELSCLKAQLEIIPAVENILELYYRTDNAAKKNSLLKSVLQKASYKKEKWQKGDDFELVLYPRLP